MCIRDSHIVVLNQKSFHGQFSSFAINTNSSSIPSLPTVIPAGIKAFFTAASTPYGERLTPTTAAGSMSFNASPLHRTIPVSYTHLDVYKRQVLGWGFEYGIQSFSQFSSLHASWQL